MPAEETILQALTAAGIQAAGSIISDSDDPPRYFVPLAVSRDSNNRQIPSNRRLHDCSASLFDLGISVHFLLRDAEAMDAEIGLRATLLHSHIEDIRNVFLSVGPEAAHVWIEPKRLLAETTLSAISDRATRYLDLLGMALGSLSTTTDESLPSKLACMITVRQLAPASLTALSVELSRRGFTIPSAHWLAHRMDALRKGGKIVRLGNGEYTLSRHSLHSLGTSKNARSPDISRLLALAKRGD